MSCDPSDGVFAAVDQRRSFDVWLATRHIVLRDQVPALAEPGLQGWFVGGNHDVIQLRGAFSHDEIGMRILKEAVWLKLPDYETFAIHRS